jgi:hypothetical protein
MICCGSGSDFGKALVPLPDPDNILQFSNNKKIVQYLAFSMSETTFFPRKLPSLFNFLNFLLGFILCWIRIQIRNRIRNKIWIRNLNRNAFRFRFCEAKAKSYGFCGSASGSTTIRVSKSGTCTFAIFGWFGGLAKKSRYLSPMWKRPRKS